MKKSLFAAIFVSSALFSWAAIADTAGVDSEIPADMTASAESLRTAVPVVEVGDEVSAQGATPVSQERAVGDCDEELKKEESCQVSDGEKGGKAGAPVEEAEVNAEL